MLLKYAERESGVEWSGAHLLLPFGKPASRTNQHNYAAAERKLF